MREVRDNDAQTAPLLPQERIERLDNRRVTLGKSPMNREVCAEWSPSGHPIVADCDAQSGAIPARFCQ